MGHRTLALLAGFIAACGLSVTGLDATSSSSSSGGSSSGGDSSIDTTTEGGAGDDDDAGVSIETIDAGGGTTTLFDAGADAATTACNHTAVIFWDSDTGNKDSATGLHDYMLTNGFSDVALGGAIGTFNGGGVGDPNTRGVVVMLLGNSLNPTMPSAGQQAIADRVTGQGVGLVTSAWFDVIFNSESDPLSQFALTQSTGYVVFGGQITLNFSDKLFWSSTSLKTAASVPYESEKTLTGVTNHATSGTDPMVFSLERGGTRVAHCALAINYPQRSRDHIGAPIQPPPPTTDDSLDKDDNVKKLFTNMALWAAHCP